MFELGWPVHATVPDVGGCGTYDASADGHVYVKVEDTTPASALRRQLRMEDGQPCLILIFWWRCGCVSCSAW